VGEWGLSLALHALSILLLTWAGIAILRARATGPSAAGAAGLGLIVVGLVASLELVMVGMLLFGSQAVSGATGAVSRVGTLLLVVGAAVFLAVRVINGPFWGDGTPDPSPMATVGFAASLVALGLGWIALGLAPKPPLPTRAAQLTS